MDETTRAAVPSRAPAALVEELIGAMLAGDAAAATRSVEAGMRTGIPARDVHWRLVQPALEMVGDAWESGLIGVADEHLATAVAEHALGAAYPAIVRGRVPNGRRLVLACAEGERHSVGLRAVADVLEGAGYDVVFLGADVPTVSLLELSSRVQPAAVGLSAAITTNVAGVARAAAGLRARDIPVVAGGRAAVALEHTIGVHVARSGEETLAAFAAAVAGRPRPAESSTAALRRAGRHDGPRREAIAEHASVIARREVDRLREALR
jgi:MerR family transcriptional regulator, light-induced transcriptional regulator